MSPRRRCGLILLVAAGLVAAFLWQRSGHRPREEARYQGKTTRQWRAEIRRHLDSRQPDPLPEWAREWFGEREPPDRFGPFEVPLSYSLDPFEERKPDHERVPVLLELVRDRDPEVRGYAAGFLHEYFEIPEVRDALVVLLTDTNAQARLAAIEAFGNAGPAARFARDGLLKQCEDENVWCRVRAAHAVWQVANDRRGLRYLARGLLDPDVTARQRSASALRTVGPDAVEAVEELSTSVHDEDRIVRMYSAAALGRAGPRGLPALREALSDDDSVVRGWAAEALGGMGAQARPAVRRLRHLLHDDEQHVRESALQALEKIESDAGPADDFVPHITRR
jgi:HEAT repeat protein